MWRDGSTPRAARNRADDPGGTPRQARGGRHEDFEAAAQPWRHRGGASVACRTYTPPGVVVACGGRAQVRPDGRVQRP